MSLHDDDCERCSARVRQRGDHTCRDCAEAIGRDTRQPFWGAFAAHPDAALRLAPKPVPYDRMSIEERPDGSARVAA